MKTQKFPKWLGSKLSEIKKTGKLDASKDAGFNFEDLCLRTFTSYYKSIKIIDISDTNITDLVGFPRLPMLYSFIANHTQISNFSNFSVLKGISQISLKRTPVSVEKSYYISLVALLSPELMIIDGKVLSDSTKQKAQSLGKLVSALLDSGWIMPIPIPDSHEIMDECQLRGISLDSSGLDELSSIDDDDQNSVMTEMSDSIELENVSNNDKKLAEGIASIFSDFGIEVDPTNYKEILSAIADLI